jgi:hypothetical protein
MASTTILQIDEVCRAMDCHGRVNRYVAYVNIRSICRSSCRCKTTCKSLLGVMVVLTLRMHPTNDIIPSYMTFPQQTAVEESARREATAHHPRKSQSVH